MHLRMALCIQLQSQACSLFLSSLDIPKTDSSVSAARGNGSAIASEVQGVDVLLVASKGDFDGSGSNVPDLGLLADSSEIRS